MIFFSLSVATAVIICCTVCVYPLLRRLDRAHDDPQAFARRLYHDQLRQLHSDQQQRIISPDDAKATANDIARRLLAAQRHPPAPPSEAPVPPAPITPWVAALVIVVIAAGSIGAYMIIGNVGMIDYAYGQ